MRRQYPRSAKLIDRLTAVVERAERTSSVGGFKALSKIERVLGPDEDEDFYPSCHGWQPSRAICDAADCLLP